MLAGAAFAQTFPAMPVTLMIPYPPGGLSDNIAHRVNVPLGAALGQPAIVDNLGGGSGSIAAQKVLNAPSDGYLVFQGSPNELILAPLAISAIKYKPEDFRQIHRIALAPMAILARANFPARNADELAELQAASYGCTAEVEHRAGYCVLVNTGPETDFARQVRWNCRARTG